MMFIYLCTYLSVSQKRRSYNPYYKLSPDSEEKKNNVCVYVYVYVYVCVCLYVWRREKNKYRRRWWKKRAQERDREKASEMNIKRECDANRDKEKGRDIFKGVLEGCRSVIEEGLRDLLVIADAVLYPLFLTSSNGLCLKGLPHTYTLGRQGKGEELKGKTNTQKSIFYIAFLHAFALDRRVLGGISLAKWSSVLNLT